MKRNLILLTISVLLFTLCLSSCAANPTGASSESPGNSTEIQDVLLTEELSQTDSDYSLGKTILTSSEDKSASVFYSPLGGAVSVELKDDNGNVWRLEIPENALPYGEKITMSLCQNIETEAVSGKRLTGVILEPEGLQFTLPATLTAKGSFAEDEPYVFYADGEGDHLSFARHTADKGSVSVPVAHFSSYIVYTPTGSSEISQAQALAGDAYETVLDEVKAFLKNPVNAPLIPDDYTFECEEEDGGNASQSRNRELDAYIRSALDPEYELVGRLLGAGYEVAQVGGETEAFYYAGLLLQRELKKADRLIMAYQNDNEKLIPVMNLTFRIIKEMGALGMDVPSGYMETFSEWMKRAADEQLRKIKEEHDYKALGPAITLVNGSAIMTSDFSASSDFTQKYLEKIKKAMTFQVKFDISVYSGIAEQRMTLKGETEIVFLDENNENSYTGTGTGKYLSYSHSGPGVTKLDLPNEYPVKIKFVDFSPCDSENIKVQVDTIGAEQEVWYNPELDERSADEYSFVNFIAEELFRDYQAESGGYIFEVPFQNKNAIIGKENFTETGSIAYPEEGSASGSITYNIEIKHTPK